MPRIYDADPGSVLIDGRPIRQFPIASLRHQIGFVPQETFLFSDTIRENIAFGVTADQPEEEVQERLQEKAQEKVQAEELQHKARAPQASLNAPLEAPIKAAAEAANIAQDIESFPDGYNTTVGERGLTLSGGQKQRAAIARALLRSPRILILDDALSSVDTQTEDKILNHLHEIMRGRTTIFISHRVSTVRNADRIAVLHQGRIVELGTHHELIARNGYYTDLYNKQLLEEELAEV